MKHQIVLLGKDITSVYHGIKEFGPDHVHLLCTEETKDLPELMYPLLSDSIIRHCYLTEPYNGEQLMKTCREIHERFTGEFSYNLSEGTKLMAFAAFRVAWEKNAHVFYLTQQRKVIELKTFRSASLNCTLTNKELIQLSGNRISAYHDIRELLPQDVRSSLLIKEFIEHYPDEHARMQKFFGLYCHRQLFRLPISHLFAKELRFKQKGGRLLITQQERILLKLPYPNACHLYFEGRWWEILVAFKVRQWSLQRNNPPETWQSVIFRSEANENQTKNEVDVLLNNEQKLVFIECKSGQVTQNDIYKIDAVRETYGGDISQAVLASYYPVDASLREKCEDLQINVFAPTYFAERLTYINQLPEWLNDLVDKMQI